MTSAHRQSQNKDTNEFSDLQWISQERERPTQGSVAAVKSANATILSLSSGSRTKSISHAMSVTSREQDENFETLARNVMNASRKQGVRVLTVTSATPRQGTSTIVYFLALMLAQKRNGRNRKNRVLIIDANSQHPAQHTFFRLEQQAGLTRIRLTDSNASSADAQPELFVLTSRLSPAGWQTFIESGKFSFMLKKLQPEFDFILIDAPAVLGNPDTIVISQATDGVMLVVHNNPLRRDAVAAARQELKENNIPVLGVVFNNHVGAASLKKNHRQ